MLDKLGTSLKNAISKIAGAIFIDQKTIDAICSELKRSLLEADVDMKITNELIEKIKKQASKDVKGLDKREQLIKFIHDELTKILGEEEKEIKIDKKAKPFKIMLLGLYGSGKCVHGDSNIPLGNGEILKIKDLYSRYKEKFTENLIEEGSIIDISNENLFVPSFNPKTCKIENKKATYLWKLDKKELMEINLLNGNDFSVKVTPEHPFFILRNQEILQIRANELSESDYVAIPNQLNISGETQNIFEEIRRLNLSICLSSEEIKRILSKYKSIKDICKKLKFKQNYCCLTTSLKQGITPIELIEPCNQNFLKIKSKGSQKMITIPIFLTSEFAEFLGYVIGDGHIEKCYVEIANEDTEVIQRFSELSKILFNIRPAIKRDFRTKKMYKVQLCSKTLVEILSIFGLKPGKKGKNLKIPKQILKSNNEVIRSFIKAYFDCDSSPSKNRSIELTSESQIITQQMSLLLERFGILSSISKKLINNIPYWRIVIKAKYAETYAEKIGYLIERKQKRVLDYKRIGYIQGYGNQDMIPVGKVLKNLRLMLGFSIGEIQSKAVYSYGRYEEKGIISRGNLSKLVHYYKEKQKGIFLELLTNIVNNASLKDIYPNNLLNGMIKYLEDGGLVKCINKKFMILDGGKQYLQHIQINETESKRLLDLFESLSDSDVCWAQIRDIKLIKNDEGHVYDLTVEDNHSFIANGIVVHNTTTASKLAFYYAKRGFKVCMLGLDVHRPAAPEQLEQMAKKAQVTCFIDKDEKNVLAIYDKYKEKIKKFDLCIIDTAGRDALSKDLLEEIEILNKEIKPNEVFLVVPADIGKSAKEQAKGFSNACKVSGVIITRIDGTAKGGGALVSCAETNAKVIFIGTGEKLPDIETFDPSSFVSRLLGMGDLKTLLEKTKTLINEEEQEKFQSRLKEGKFTLVDFCDQIKNMQKMGPLDKVAELIPGLGNLGSSIGKKLPDMFNVQEEKMKRWRFAIDSMTQAEREDPDLLDSSRIARISKGSNVPTNEIRELIKQYKMIKEFTTGSMAGIDPSKGGMDQKTLQKLAKKFGRRMM